MCISVYVCDAKRVPWLVVFPGPRASSLMKYKKDARVGIDYYGLFAQLWDRWNYNEARGLNTAPQTLSMPGSLYTYTRSIKTRNLSRTNTSERERERSKTRRNDSLSPATRGVTPSAIYLKSTRCNAFIRAAFWKFRAYPAVAAAAP